MINQFIPNFRTLRGPLLIHDVEGTDYGPNGQVTFYIKGGAKRHFICRVMGFNGFRVRIRPY